MKFAVCHLSFGSLNAHDKLTHDYIWQRFFCSTFKTITCSLISIFILNSLCRKFKNCLLYFFNLILFWLKPIAKRNRRHYQFWQKLFFAFGNDFWINLLPIVHLLPSPFAVLVLGFSSSYYISCIWFFTFFKINAR